VVGATASAVFGAAAVMLEGGWIRRLVVLVPLGVTGLWWFLAVALSSIRAVPCDACPPRTPDPWAYAYSIPPVTLWYLILPSLIVVALALVRRRQAEPGTYISPS